jgi:hypothetical protein
VVQENLPLGGTQDFWFGPAVTMRKDDFALRLFGIVNTGDLGVGTLSSTGTVVSGFTSATARSHTGFALRAEAEKPLAGVNFKAQAVYTTGDADGEVDDRFATPMGLFGTSGYWGSYEDPRCQGPFVSKGNLHTLTIAAEADSS